MAAKTVSTLEVEIGLKDNLTKGLKKSNKSVTDFASSLTGANLTALGIGAAFVGIGVASVDAAMKWETAFAGVEKTVDASSTELGLLEDQLRSMAMDSTNPVAGLENAAVTLAKIAEMGGSLGIAIGDMDEFTETIAMLAMTTDLTAESASTMIAQFANMTGMDASDYDNFGSALVDLGNKTAATEGQILEFAQRIAAAGERAGFSEDEILAFSASMASFGLNPEAGGSAFSQAMNTIVEAAALGGPKLETLAETAGMTADAFRDGWADDPAATLVAFLEGLGDMTAAEQLATLAELGWSGIRLTDTMSRMASNTDLVTGALETSADAWEENNALVNEAEKRFDTTEAKMNLFKNNLNELGIQLGDALLPVLNDVTASLTDLVSSINQDGATGGGDWLLSAVEDIGNGLNDISGLGGGADIILPDVTTALAGWETFFDSLGILIANAGVRLEADFNTIAVGARTFIRDVEELAARALIAGADINNFLGKGSAANDAAWNFGTASVQASEDAKALEQMMLDGLASGDISIDMSELVTSDPKALAEKLVNPLLVQEAINQLLGEGDNAGVAALVPIAMEMGIDTDSLYNQFYTKAQEAGALGTVDVGITAAVTVNPGSIDLAPIYAGIQSMAAGGGIPISALPSMPHFADGGMMQSDGVAMLHAGERVLNPQETAAYNSGGGGSGNTQININGIQDVDRLRLEILRRGGLDILGLRIA